MKITEEIVAPLRKEIWLNTVSLVDNGFDEPTLPADFFEASDELFPQLGDGSGDVVALIAFTESVPLLSPARNWYAVRHQSGGSACNHCRLVGSELKLRATARLELRALAQRYFSRGGGHFYSGNVGASDVVDYVDALARLGLHCERSYRLLQEGVYPIDATQAHLDLLTEDLIDLKIIADDCGYGGLTIVVLAENSD